jgi:hypothetical protein
MVVMQGVHSDTNRDATQSGIPANGYTLVSLAASYDLGHGVTAFGRIDNLLNRQYQDPLGFDHPGLGIYVGLRLALWAGRGYRSKRRNEPRMNSEKEPQRVIDPDDATVEIFPLPTDGASLETLLRELFETHWRAITFGPLIQGAAWEMRAPHAPTHVGVLDGYLTIAFGASHFHICIGPTRGPRHAPTPPSLARHRQTARAELYRRLDRSGSPVSWGLRLFNGGGEQQLTILLPNPFLSPDGEEILREPDWSRLALWDELRARWTGAAGPDPVDRTGRGFTH